MPFAARVQSIAASEKARACLTVKGSARRLSTRKVAKGKEMGNNSGTGPRKENPDIHFKSNHPLFQDRFDTSPRLTRSSGHGNVTAFIGGICACLRFPLAAPPRYGSACRPRQPRL